MQTVRVQHEFAAPPQRVYEHLAEHESLATVFAPARVVRVRDGDSDRNGVGSVRRLSSAGLLPFEETVTGAVPGELIEYRITKGTPLRHHLGVMRLAPNASGGTRLDYTIELDAGVPGLAPAVAAVLRRRIAAGLRKVDAALPA
jgi:uncharacterized protein YndB with AHSA1/START domain